MLMTIVSCQLQLNRARDEGLVLMDFEEGPLNFKPTFKYDLGCHEYDTR